MFYSERRGVWVGRAVVDGRRVERSDPSQQEMLRKLALAKPPSSGITLAEWAARWRSDPDSTGRLKPATLRGRATALDRYVLPALGHLKVAALTPDHVERAVKNWTTLKSPNSVLATLATLSAALRAAVRAGVIESNPVARARKPRPHARRGVKIFSGAELSRIAEAAGNRPGAARPLALLAATGMRVGEAIGLDVTHLDAAAGTVSVTRTCDPCAGPLESTKSPNSVRTLELPAETLAALRAAAGSRKSGPLFAGARGGRCRYPEVARAWRALLAELGLEYRNLHQLRHSVGSHLVASGMDVAEVSRYLGDTPATVWKVYVRPTGGDVAGAISELLGWKKGGRGRGEGEKKSGKSRGKSRPA